MEGKFIVVEGIDGAGKSTLIQTVLAIAGDAKVLHSRGFTHNSIWDETIHSNPHSWLYYVDLAVKTVRMVKPALTRREIVLQDRYVQTVDTFSPDCNWRHNQIIRKVLGPLFLKPDLYVQVTATREEITRRLSQSAPQEGYHAFLLQHPEEIEQRENNYRKLLTQMSCPKYVIDTTKRTAEDSGLEFIDLVRRELQCW